MNEQKLQRVIELILRSASEDDLDLLAEAVERRREALRSTASVQPREMAHRMAESIGHQVRQSLGQVQELVREAVAEIIRRKAPELTEEQVGMLLRAWLPGQDRPDDAAPAGGDGSGGDGIRGSGASGGLPPEALMTMVRQFISFSTGMMTVTEQAQLRDTIPDWPRLYWERFPETVRRLVRELLQQRIGPEQFWQRLRARLAAP